MEMLGQDFAFSRKPPDEALSALLLALLLTPQAPPHFVPNHIKWDLLGPPGGR